MSMRDSQMLEELLVERPAPAAKGLQSQGEALAARVPATNAVNRANSKVPLRVEHLFGSMSDEMPRRCKAALGLDERGVGVNAN